MKVFLILFSLFAWAHQTSSHSSAKSKAGAQPCLDSHGNFDESADGKCVMPQAPPQPTAVPELKLPEKTSFKKNLKTPLTK